MLFSYKFFIRQFNPRQQTLAIKSHNHQNTTTTPPQQQQKSKSHRNQNHIERKIGGAKIGGSKARSRGGEIERRGAIGPVRSERSMRSARCDQHNRSYDRRGAIWCMRSSDCSSRFALFSLSLQTSFEVKIGMEMNFRGHGLFFSVN